MEAGHYNHVENNIRQLQSRRDFVKKARCFNAGCAPPKTITQSQRDD